MNDTAGSVSSDPFGETSNPAEYVPREASEEALLAVERAVRAGRTAALTAPPGLGKSLLLRLLAKRLAPGRCIFLPYAALTLEELCAWSLGLLGEAVSDDSRADFLRFVRREAEDREPLVLLIDDGSSMPLETARSLGEMVRESGNRMRVVLAAADDAISSRVLAALHREIVWVRFTEPMDLLETRLYVRTRLEQASISRELCERFDEDAVGWIHRLSGGVPRRVHELSRSLLEEAPEGVGNAWREDRWLGAPIEDVDPSFLGDSAGLASLHRNEAERELQQLLLDEDEDLELL